MDIHPFVKYGCITDNKFYDSVKNVLLYKLTDGTYVTLEEYKTRNADKVSKPVEGEEGKTTGTVYYCSDPRRQAGAIQLFTQRGIDVVVLDFKEIDANFIQFMEYGSYGEQQSAWHFARVDADVNGLTQDSTEGSELDQDKLQQLFRKALENDKLEVQLNSLASADLTAVVTEDEQMRRMKEVYRMKDMPAEYRLVLNRRNATVQALAARDPEDELTMLLCRQVYDLARMSAAPLENEEITAFLERSQKLISLLVK